MLAVPSVTWIAGHYPKGLAFYRWLADRGWDEAQAIKAAAGDKGNKVHNAITAILNGEEVRIDSKFAGNDSKQPEELTFEEVGCIKSFLEWRAPHLRASSLSFGMSSFSRKSMATSATPEKFARESWRATSALPAITTSRANARLRNRLRSPLYLLSLLVRQ